MAHCGTVRTMHRNCWPSTACRAADKVVRAAAPTIGVAKVARPLPQKPTPPKKKEEVLEVSDADLVEEPKDDETKLDDGLEFEWAPVPAVPGLGR